jgi:hypothetical protein
MGKKKRADNRLDVTYYAVAFVDLLGQQERLRALTGC